MTPTWGTRIRAVLAAVALLSVVAVAATTDLTRAAWSDREHPKATLTARTVAPPTGLDCTGSALTGLITMTWAKPPRLPKGGYAWTFTGVVSRSGTLPSGATSLVQTIPLLTLGTGTFTLRAKGQGKWTSPPVSTTFLVVTGGVITC